MNNPLTWIGAIVVALAALGALGPFDFELCFGPKGYCTCPATHS